MLVTPWDSPAALSYNPPHTSQMEQTGRSSKWQRQGCASFVLSHLLAKLHNPKVANVLQKPGGTVISAGRVQGLRAVDITCDMLPVHALGTPSTPLPRRWVYLRGCAAAGAAWDTNASGGGWRQESGSGKDDES